MKVGSLSIRAETPEETIGRPSAGEMCATIPGMTSAIDASARHKYLPVGEGWGEGEGEGEGEG